MSGPPIVRHARRLLEAARQRHPDPTVPGASTIAASATITTAIQAILTAHAHADANDRDEGAIIQAMASTTGWLLSLMPAEKHGEIMAGFTRMAVLSAALRAATPAGETLQ